MSFRRWKKILSIIFDDFLNWNKPNVLLNFEKSWINLEHRNFLSKSPSWYWCLSVSVSDRYRPIWKKSYRQFIGSADLKNGIYRCLSVSADMKKSLSVVPWWRIRVLDKRLSRYFKIERILLSFTQGFPYFKTKIWHNYFVIFQ